MAAPPSGAIIHVRVTPILLNTTDCHSHTTEPQERVTHILLCSRSFAHDSWVNSLSIYNPVDINGKMCLLLKQQLLQNIISMTFSQYIAWGKCCAILITHFCVLLMFGSNNQFPCPRKWLTVQITPISSWQEDQTLFWERTAVFWEQKKDISQFQDLSLERRKRSWSVTSSFPVAVLARDSFIIAFDGFATALQETSWHFLDWLTFIHLSCSCHNMDLVFYQIGLFSVYHPYLVTTQLIGSNALRKEIPQINF